jgi:hypothetical protein
MLVMFIPQDVVKLQSFIGSCFKKGNMTRVSLMFFRSFLRFIVPASLAFFCVSVFALSGGGLHVEPGSAVTLPQGSSIELNCNALNVEGSLELGDAEILNASDAVIASGGLLDAGAGLVTVGRSWNNAGIFVPGTSTVVFAGNCGDQPTTISGATEFCNVTLGAGKTYILSGDLSISPSCTLDLGQGNTLISATPGTTVNLVLGPGASVLGLASLSGVIIGNLFSNVQSIPTLGTFSFLILAVLLALIGWRKAARVPSSARKR